MPIYLLLYTKYPFLFMFRGSKKGAEETKA